MTESLVLEFEDFKSLVSNHRIYYYEGDNFFDFHFITEGLIVKTTVLKSLISNYEQFFSQKMFYGAIRLKFNISVPEHNPFTIVNEGVKTDMVGVFQDDEMKNEDIQKDGVE